MGTIICQYNNRIVQIENEIEGREIRSKRIAWISVAVIVAFLILIRMDIFNSLNSFNKITLITGTVLLMSGMYVASKEDHDRTKVRTLILTGAAFFLTSVLAMLG